MYAHMYMFFDVEIKLEPIQKNLKKYILSTLGLPKQNLQNNGYQLKAKELFAKEIKVNNLRSLLFIP